MDWKQIIAKLEEKEVGSDVVNAIKALDQTAEVERLKSELESEQGKAKGILEDKRKYKDRAEKAEGELKKIEDSKLPEEERHKKELDEMRAQLEAEKAEREKQTAEFAKAQREAKEADVTASIKWADGLPTGTAKLIIKNALADIDDLSDQAKVDDALKSVKESHKSFIAADAPSGTGGKSGGGSLAGSGKDEAASIADNQKAIWGDK